MKKCSFPGKFVLIFRGHNICHTWKDITGIKGAADKHGDVTDRCKRGLTALFTKPLSSVLPAVGTTSETIPATSSIEGFRDGMVEQWNSTRQYHGTAENREAGEFVNSAVKQRLFWFYSAIHKAAGSLVTGRSLQNGKCLWGTVVQNDLQATLCTATGRPAAL